jgi:hypothetical protein
MMWDAPVRAEIGPRVFRAEPARFAVRASSGIDAVLHVARSFEDRGATAQDQGPGHELHCHL